MRHVRVQQTPDDLASSTYTYHHDNIYNTDNYTNLSVEPMLDSIH